MFAVFLLAGMLAWQQTPREQRAAPSVERGTAVLGGRVTDKDTGAPLAGVTVVLAMSASGPQDGRFTRTGDDGRYRFTEVAAGSYILAADTGEHRPTHLVQNYGDSSFRSLYGLRAKPKPVAVKEGEVRDNLHIAMWRALAIGGTVVTAAGEPMANIPVQARAIVRGRTFSGGPNRTTDDRGAFRLFGLPPGRYLLCTQLNSYVSSVSDRPERLVPTCHPSAVREEDAAIIVLAGGDTPDVQIRMQQMRPVRLTGTVLDSTGAPAAHATVSVEGRERLARFAGEVIVRAGQFTVEGLLPGEYRLLAHAQEPDQNDFQKGQLGSLTVNLDASDLDGVVISMTKAATVAGHVMFGGGAIPRLTDRPAVRTSFVPGGISAKPADVRDDLTFELQGLFGPQLLEVTNVPSGWILESVHYNGADITDVPVTFTASGDARALRITLTDRAPIVSGRVVDDTGQPSAGARVFLFPEDPGRLRRGASGVAQSADDGAFSLGRQRAGNYLVVAVPDDEVSFDERPDLTRLAKVAERVTLDDGQPRALTLRLAKLPEER
jgi:5-hydroxyisourate hydrolase-like protein (transthyretin family)